MLVAIAIPVFTAALHNSKAAADEANCRAIYADLQADYLANADSTYTAPTEWGVSGNKITFSDGQEEELSVDGATVTATFNEDHGWTVAYDCGKDDTHVETWGYQA